MPNRTVTLACAACLALCAPRERGLAADTFSVATYNVENYLDEPAGTRRPKTAAARARIRESIRALRPDVLAIEEMGGTNALLELRAALRTEGLDFPYWEHVSGFDTNIHVAVLSRLQIVARRQHTNEGFLLNGRRFPVSRGFAEVDIQVNPAYRFTLLAAHLKSRREVPEADQADLREQEAAALRGIIDSRLAADPEVNLIVLGDFNDLRSSRALRTLIGRGKRALIDVRPVERHSDGPIALGGQDESRTVAWTYYFARDDTYSRIDYILLSAGMAREWQPDATYVLALPGWGTASDHRPIMATFVSRDVRP